MKDIFDINNYIIEADDDGGDTDFSSASTSNLDDNPNEDNDNVGDTDFGTDDTEIQRADGDEDTDFEAGEEETDDTGEEDGEATDDEYGDEEEFDGEDAMGDDDEPVDLVAMEKNLYKDLSDFDLNTRNKELKDMYNSLYDFLCNLVDRIVRVKKGNVYNVKVMEYCEEKIIALRDVTYSYIINNFSNSTYIQNQIRYKRILFMVSKIVDLLEKTSIENKDN